VPHLDTLHLEQDNKNLKSLSPWNDWMDGIVWELTKPLTPAVKQQQFQLKSEAIYHKNYRRKNE
jgi:hypothetical protein